jgi:hypothetical protein
VSGKIALPDIGGAGLLQDLFATGKVFAITPTLT